MSGKRFRVLLSAFACDPYFGSDEEVGWQWARELSSRGFEVTALVWGNHRKAIEEAVEKTGDCAGVQFEYIHWPLLHKLLHPISGRGHVYYYFWQWAAFLRARQVLRSQSVDLIHHVTWVSLRQPSFMGLLGKPFVFGPVAGGDEIPNGYMRDFSFQQKFIEYARVVLNRLVRIDPLMRMTFAGARRIYVTSQSHLPLMPRAAKRKTRIELAIGASPEAAEPAQPDDITVSINPGAPRLLFVGRLIGWKGLDIGLRAFARILAERPQTTLTIIGDGSERHRWQALAAELGIAHALTWRGWITKAEVLSQYRHFDAFFYPSLRDSGGFVVLEALQNGLPVVCFRLGGPGVVASALCAETVEPHPSVDQATSEFADATLRLIERRAQEPGMSQACRDRVLEFTWDALLKRIYSDLGVPAELLAPRSPRFCAASPELP